MDFSHLFFKVLSNVYNYTLLIAVLYALYCYKKQDKSVRFICILIVQSGIVEVIASFAAWKFRNNLSVYAVSSVIEFALICLYFNESLILFKKNKIGKIVAFVGVLFEMINMRCLQPIHTINSNFLFFECLATVCFCLFSIYRRLIVTDGNILKEVHFWISCILLFYQCSTLWNWGIYNYAVTLAKEKTIWLNISMLLINVLTYLAFTLLLFFAPKMSRTNV